MIIIYNVSGLLIGLAGLAVGMFIFMASLIFAGPITAFAIGLLAVAASWAILGYAWRNHPAESGTTRPWPALFFVPLPFAAIPVVFMAVSFFTLAIVADSRFADPRAALLNVDEKELSAFAATGDVELSNELLSTLQDIAAKEALADKYHIFTKVKEESVLVLVKIPNLKNYSDDARRELLTIISDELETTTKTKDKQAFIGIKGKISFGAMQAPPNRVMVDKFLSEEPLYDFYGPMVVKQEKGGDGVAKTTEDQTRQDARSPDGS